MEIVKTAKVFTGCATKFRKTGRLVVGEELLIILIAVTFS